MKTLYLIRHAKSDWDTTVKRDIERPLNERGLRDATMMAKQLQGLNFKPSILFCSPAQRTVTTSELITKDMQIIFEKKIYEASLQELTKLIDEFPDEHSEVALIGHNPSMTYLSNYLTGEFINSIPTCSVIKIELEINSWKEITQGIGTQKFFIYPKMYPF
jgi:phosphohistidine phosphatase